MGVKKGKRSLSLGARWARVCWELRVNEWARLGSRNQMAWGTLEMIGPPRTSFHQEAGNKSRDAIQARTCFTHDFLRRPTFRQIPGITEEQAVFLHIASGCLPRGGRGGISMCARHYQEALVSEMLVDDKVISFFSCGMKWHGGACFIATSLHLPRQCRFLGSLGRRMFWRTFYATWQ